MVGFLKRWAQRRKTPTWQPLCETPRYRRQFTRWVKARVYRNWTGPWFKAYHYHRAGLRPAWPVQPLPPAAAHTPLRGVALLYDERIGPVNFDFLFTLLRERVLALGYRVAHADEHACAANPAVDSVRKYVLHPLPVAEAAPAPATEAGCCNQRFGQITVDMVRRHRQPLMIRLLTMPLPGAAFTPAPSFDELLLKLLGHDDELPAE